MFSKRRVYLDYASATPLLPEAARAMREAEKLVGNPGGIHQEAVAAKRSLENSREGVARELGCKTREIIFTSGLTEANNLAILGFARSLERIKRGLSGTHWIVSAIEHSSVLESFAEVERLGGSVTHILPDSRGLFSPETVQKSLRNETVFVSIGWGNNEIGIIQPLSKIARAIGEYGGPTSAPIIFHSDAGQAPLYLSSTAHSLGIDLLSLGSAKMHGPHGVGALFVHNRANLVRVLLGGPQERELRPGTENVALAAGFAAAYKIVASERDTESKRLQILRDDFAKQILEQIPNVIVNGDLKHTLPHMLNISIPPITTSDVVMTTEYMTLALDHAGIALSTKSACREGEESRSHVVEALGGEPWRAENTIRFSLGRETSESDLSRVVSALVAAESLNR